MRALVCGAEGFVGRAVCAALELDGHSVLRGVRHATGTGDVEMDFAADVTPDAWLDRLHGVDVVINAVGILVERGAQTFDAIHHRAPVALFDACRRAGVTRIVQISALGADTGVSRFFATKLAADNYLQTQPVGYQIVRPALVFGVDGASSRFFRALASFPVQLLPAGGHQLLRPVHISELACVVARLANPAVPDRQIVDVVGGTQVEYRQMLSIYRASMGFAPAIQVSVPRALIGAGAALFDRVPATMLTRDSWRMLETGNTADVEQTAAILGRLPAGIEMFMGSADAARLRADALAAWRPLVLRGALAATWIWTAIASAFIYPRAASIALLSHMHLHGALALAALYSASALDILFGIATLVRPGRRLWAAEAALIAAYSIVIAIVLPEFLTHPFGPVLKNLPILAVLLVLFSEETRP